LQDPGITSFRQILVFLCFPFLRNEFITEAECPRRIRSRLNI
jgi:hypothetical protein